MKFREPVRKTVPNFVTISQTAAFSNFQNGGHTLSWTCYACVYTTYEQHLVFLFFL